MTKRAVLYCRVSTDRQGQSKEDQVAEMEKYAKKHGYRIVGEPYVDFAKSGAGETKSRRALLALFKIIESNEAYFDVVLCYDVTRWGRFRNDNEAAHWEFIANDHGIEIEYTNETFTSEHNLGNKLHKELRRAEASDFSRHLSADVIRTMTSFAKQGYWMGMSVYGYDRAEVDGSKKPIRILKRGERKAIKGHHVILVPGNKKEIAVVRKIFEMSKNGVGVKQIAYYLNEKRIPTPRGRYWSIAVVSGILTNRIYTGTLVWGKIKNGKFSRYENNWGDKSDGRWHDKDKWIVVKNAYEPLIDQTTFDKVQRGLHRRRFDTSNKSGRPFGSQYLLSGLLVCQHCGQKYVSFSSHRDRRTPFLVYRCSGHVNFGDSYCQARPVLRRDLDESALTSIAKYLNNPAFEKSVEDIIREKVATELSTSRNEKLIKKEVDEVKRKIDRLIDALEDDNNPHLDLLNKRLTERRDELQELEEELSSLRDKKENAKLIDEYIAEVKSNFADARKYLTDSIKGDHEINEIKKQIIRQFIHHVVVNQKEGKVFYYFNKFPSSLMPKPSAGRERLRKHGVGKKHGTDTEADSKDGSDEFLVETLVLHEDVISDDEGVWYRYSAYAKEKKMTYNQVKHIVRLRRVRRKLIRGRNYISDFPDGASH